MPCKITSNISNDACEYSIAGIVAIYLANYLAPSVAVALPEDPIDGVISYAQNATTGAITGIQLPEDEFFYRVEVAEGTGSFADQLLAGGSGGKYRQHQVNGTITASDASVLASIDALSLGRFVAIVETAKGYYILGRYGGLTAPANGMDFASGAAAADANGWTMILQGATSEVHKPIPSTIVPGLLDLDVIVP